MKFVLDENLPPRMARILNQLQEESPHEVLHVAADLNLKGAADVEWFAKLDPGHRWAILTHDSGVRRNPIELAAWTSQGHIVFFLARAWQFQPLHELAWRLVRWWPAIVHAAERASPGDALMIPFKESPARIQNLEVRRKGRARRRRRRWR